jgi:hypothetical protein
MAAGTGKGRRGARRRAGAGAAVHELDKEGWRSVAHHSRTTKTRWPAWKILRWRGSATAVVRWRSGGEQGRSTREYRGCEPAARKTQRRRCKSKGKERKVALVLHRRRELHRRQWRNRGGGDGERMPKRVCLQCESKGESGSSGSTLYSDRERERGGETEGQVAGGLP